MPDLASEYKQQFDRLTSRAYTLAVALEENWLPSEKQPHNWRQLDRLTRIEQILDQLEALIRAPCADDTILTEEEPHVFPTD